MGHLQTEQVFQSFDTLFSFSRQDVAVAVSGGSDSMGLLLLLSDWCKSKDLNLKVVTVNHQLRESAQKECEFVEGVAKGLGWKHQTLYWKNQTQFGNLSKKAREGRYQLMSEWGASLGIDEFFLGHTQNDQAETVLMELKRKAGVDGLSAMPNTIKRFGVTWIRPMLDFSRCDIQDYLRANNQEWIEDPSNEDCSRTRIKIRKILPVLEDAGITVDSLATVASNLQKTREVLQKLIQQKAEEVISVSKVGEYVFHEDYWGLPEEIRGKLFARVVQFLANDDYKPRQSAVNNCLTRVKKVGSATINNFVIQKDGNNCVRIFRDPKKIRGFVHGNQFWDNRWRVVKKPKMNVRLGNLASKGLNQLNMPKGKEFTTGGLLSSPALWSEEGELIETVFNDFGTSIVFKDTKNKAAFLLFLEGN